MFKFKEYDYKHYKFSILFVVLLLGGIGSYVMQYVQEAGESHFERQVAVLFVGIVMAAFISLFDYHFICKFFIPLYLFNMLMLLAVKFSIFGGSHFKAKRWLRFPNGKIESTEAWFEIQPSELSKIILILFTAKLLDLLQKRINKWYVIVITGILVIIPVLFIFIQPDLSTSIVIGITFVIMVFVAGISYKIVIPALIVGIPSVMALYWYIQQPFQKLIDPYQQDRILAIKYPDSYPDLMWQQDNAAKAIKSGGMIGRIMTENIEKLGCSGIAAIESDFIFAPIAEGFGFIGCCIVLLLFGFFIYKCLLIAKNSRDKLGTVIAAGIATQVMMQVFVNVGVVTSILPNTGIPLPFVSSGRSAMLSFMIMIGILLNIDMQHKINKEVE